MFVDFYVERRQAVKVSVNIGELVEDDVPMAVLVESVIEKADAVSEDEWETDGCGYQIYTTDGEEVKCR